MEQPAQGVPQISAGDDAAPALVAAPGAKRQIQRVNSNRRMFKMWRRRAVHDKDGILGYRYDIRRLPVSTRHNGREGVFSDPRTGRLVHCPLHWKNRGWKLVECPPDLVSYQGSTAVAGSLTPDPMPVGWEEENRKTDELHKATIQSQNAQQGVAESLKQLVKLAQSQGVVDPKTTALSPSDDLSAAPSPTDG